MVIGRAFYDTGGVDGESPLLLRQMEIGPMQNYVYFVGCARTRDVAVVDPAWDVPALLARAAAEGLRITDVLVSHGHFDHVNGVDELVEKTDARVHVNRREAEFFGLWAGRDHVRLVDHGDELRLGDVEVRFLHTPGHTPGSQSFAVRGQLVTGDTMFIDGCGRCDFDGGDPNEMYRTLHDRIGALPDDTVVLPGHNYAPRPTDTLGGQRRTNRFFLCKDLEDFVRVRMAPRH
jgi:hydroxyacylglutathione hydrolase